jgi:hypothetical protein
MKAADSSRMLGILDAQQKPGGTEISKARTGKQKKNQKECSKNDERDGATLRSRAGRAVAFAVR